MKYKITTRIIRSGVTEYRDSEYWKRLNYRLAGKYLPPSSDTSTLEKGQ